MIIKSAGFISSSMIRSQNALNFAYVLFLKLRDLGTNPAEIESYVRRWFVFSVLTGRYSGSPESVFDFDIKQIAHKPFAEYLKEKEEGELSEAFWTAALPQGMNTSVASSPYFHVFLASLIKANDKGFLSRDVLVSDLIKIKGDIHHLFPKDYLKKNGLERGQYNQIANYVYMQSEINIKVGNKSPQDYFKVIYNQLLEGNKVLSGITTEEELQANLKANCIPLQMGEMTVDNYQEFLTQRRILMSEKMRGYYFGL
jgi:hypothetical protein